MDKNEGRLGGISLDDDICEDITSENKDVSPISPMVNFLIAHREKIMQICLAEDKNLDLKKFDIIFRNIVNDDILSAMMNNTRLTTLIIKILDINKIN